MPLVSMMFTLAIYCFINSAVMVGLFLITQPSSAFFVLFKKIFSRTALSIGIVLAFFAFLARMFCMTAWIMNCFECICFPFTVQDLVMQTTLPSNILFFVSVTAVQLALIVIPNRLSPLSFVMIVLTGNVIASLLKLGIVAVWGL
jgi:hypothetical protein